VSSGRRGKTRVGECSSRAAGCQNSQYDPFLMRSAAAARDRPPPAFGGFCVMTTVCVLVGREAAPGADSVTVGRLAGVACTLASMALGVAARVGLTVAGIALAGAAFDGVSLTNGTVSARALTAESCAFRSAFPDAALPSPIR
jgi:hypothetical protein